MKTDKKNIKNLKIRPEVHTLLKNYCNNNGLKMYKYLEKIITENCKEVKDIYGE